MSELKDSPKIGMDDCPICKKKYNADTFSYAGNVPFCDECLQKYLYSQIPSRESTSKWAMPCVDCKKEPENGKLKFINGMPYCNDCIKHFNDLYEGVMEKVNLHQTSDNPLLDQINGTHYKNLKIQPVEFIHENNIPFLEGNVIKYIVRWRKKGGLKDLEKARHYIDLIIEMENLGVKETN